MGETITKELGNWIGGEEQPTAGGAQFENRSPQDGSLLNRVAKSTAEDVDRAITAVRQAQPAWAAVPAVQRGHLLHQVCTCLEAHQREIAEIVAKETGKSPKETLGETGGAITLGRFFASEGQRLYGRTTTNGVPEATNVQPQ